MQLKAFICNNKFPKSLMIGKQKKKNKKHACTYILCKTKSHNIVAQQYLLRKRIIKQVVVEAICQTYGDGKTLLEAVEVISQTWGDGRSFCEVVEAISHTWGGGKTLLEVVEAIFLTWGDGRSFLEVVGAIWETWGDGKSFLVAMEAIWEIWGDGSTLEGFWEEVEVDAS